MSDDPSGLELLKQAKEERNSGDDDSDGTEGPKNLSSNEEETGSSTDEPKNLSSKEGEEADPSDETATSDDDVSKSAPKIESSSTATSSRSSRGRRSSRSRREERRSDSSSTSRHVKAFMFAPEEERRFNHLLADVKSLVRQEYPEASVQNSQLVRAMVEMTIEDLEQGEDLILDYVLDQIEKDRQSS